MPGTSLHNYWTGLCGQTGWKVTIRHLLYRVHRQNCSIARIKRLHANTKVLLVFNSDSTNCVLTLQWKAKETPLKAAIASALNKYCSKDGVCTERIGRRKRYAPLCWSYSSSMLFGFVLAFSLELEINILMDRKREQLPNCLVETTQDITVVVTSALLVIKATHCYVAVWHL